jgi:hypothetical protein
MKVTAYIWEHSEGSDDPRAIEGGGGPGKRCIETRTNSAWLIRAYVRALTNRYNETYSYSLVASKLVAA